MLAAMLVPLLLGGCGAGCEDEVVQHEPSPYGRGAAIVFVRGCGEATGNSTQIALVGHVDAPPSDRGVFFVADADDGAAADGPAGGPRVRVRWIDGNHIEVAHDARARITRKDEESGYVRLTYVALP
jgi:hypothetical protein